MRTVAAVVIAFVVGVLAATLSQQMASTEALPAQRVDTSDTPQPQVVPTSTSAPPTSQSATTVLVSTTALDPVVIVLESAPPTFETALAWSRSLPAVRPTDCEFDPGASESLPNAARSYRNGIHQGIDFICAEQGRTATAALAGRVATVVRDYVEPTPADRGALLDVAAQIGRTPPWLLNSLYGNFVVLDHGYVDGVGHVITIYAHLESVEADVVAGVQVASGQTLGQIGNSGTATAASGGDRPQSIHLHWEIHIDDVFLGAGLSADETRQVYAELFSPS